jgi:Transglutaminase-like superfamily
MTEPRRLGRLRRLADVVQTPADALLLSRVLAWAALLPILKRTLPTNRLVALMSPRRRRAETPGYREKVATLTQWAYRSPVLRDNCLERSLLAHRYLPAGGEQRLWFGVRREGTSVPGHVWLTVDGVPIHETHESLEEFTVVVAFDELGRVIARRADIPLPATSRVERH